MYGRYEKISITYNYIIITIITSFPEFGYSPRFFRIGRVVACTVAAVEISDRKDLNTLYKFRNLISVNRIFINDYKVSVSI
jgi:hypothetical protein